MSLLTRLALSAFVWLAVPVAAGAQGFTHPTLAKDAQRYETFLKSTFKIVPKNMRDTRVEAERTLAAGTDARAAARGFAALASANSGDADAWAGLARALLAIKPDSFSGSDSYEIPVNASGAAWLAYERAVTPARKADALAILADALKRRSYFRPAIDALKTSLELADRPDVRRTYELLRAEHGFRMVDYKIDQEAASPRLCLQFSERLAVGGTDFATFLRVDGRDPQNVTAEARQLCIDGFVHGRRYEVQVRQGLPSAIGEVLPKSAEMAVYVRDRTASVRTTGRAYVLPSKGQQGIPITSVNTASVAIEVYRVGDRGLAHMIQNGDWQRAQSSYDVENLKERAGAKVYQGELAVTERTNEEVTTAFPVSEAIPTLQPGVYLLAARAVKASATDREERRPATQWFIVSDLGLTTLSGDDGLHTFVRSLATAAPVARANIKLVAKNNEILGTGVTDAQGRATFAAGLKRGEGGMAPAYIAAETTGGDYAFLDLASAAFDLTDRGSKGREPPGAIDGFAFTDRGVYRAGEAVHFTGLVRDRAGNAAAVPVVLIVTRPDGVEHKRMALADQGLGGRTLTHTLGANAMSGTWRMKLHTDPKAEPIAQAAFLVEDFQPERLDLKLEAATPSIAADEPGSIRIAGRYLYGPPAAGLAVESDVLVRAAKGEHPQFPGYRFGLADEKIAPVRKTLENLPVSGADGLATIAVALPPNMPRTVQPLEADVIVRLRETGGRTIERTITLPVDPKAARIGIKPLFAGGQVANGDTAAFDAILLGADGTRKPAAGLKWELFQLEQRWQWYNHGGSWSYDTTTSSRRVATGTVAAATDANADAPGRIAAATQWGRYRLDVSAADGSGALSSVTFTSGYYADETADSPEVLEIGLDKPAYAAGDTARVRIASKVAGKALVAVVGAGLTATYSADLPAGGGEVAVPVTADLAPGAYVSVFHYRPLDESAKRMPSRAVGLKWLAVDPQARRLAVTLAAPDKVKSAGTLVVPVKLEGLAAGDSARVTVTAVDVGILNLTRFEPPKPEAWFFGQRRLGVEIRDFYARLIDGMRAERGRLRSGGDGAGDSLAMQGSPPVEATLALFSGLVEVGRDGTAQVEFQLPDFNGTVRLSAVAWSGAKVGSAHRDVIVRDPVALTVSGPRFLTMGDSARIELAVHNVEGAAGEYRMAATREATPEGGAALSLVTRAVSLTAGQRKAEAFDLRPTEVGRQTVAIRITGPGGIDVARKLSFDVKPPAGDIRRVTVAKLAANGGRLTLGADLLADLIPGRTRVTVQVGPMSRLDVAGQLSQLDRYPHGCAEQTVSRALPLVYLNDVARRIGVAADSELRERVQKAVERVFDMQDASGAFGIWGPADGDMWLTSYVTDFLVRAKEANYAVTAQKLGQALDRLANFVSTATDFERGGEARAYALYVLARAGRAPVGELRYDVDTRLARFATPLAQAQLGAALSMTGDKPRAEKAFAAALAQMNAGGKDVFRRDYGSGLRDGAALVTLASETGLAREAMPGLVDVIAKAAAVKTYTSTQEQAWMVLAARALADQAGDLVLDVNGVASKGQLLRTLTAAELQGAGITIGNPGDAATDAVVSVIGAALTPEPAIERGFKIERSYYTLEGKPVDLASAAGGQATLRQNDRLVAVVKIEAPEAGGRIIVVDRLPAGLEIENPRLVDSGDIKSLDWLKATVSPEHTDFKDDRFVAAFNFFGGNTNRRRNGDDEDGTGTTNGKKGPIASATVAYMVRAVTPGSFVHPAATVEDMYRPERFARTAAGRLTVTAKE